MQREMAAKTAVTAATARPQRANLRTFPFGRSWNGRERLKRTFSIASSRMCDRAEESFLAPTVTRNPRGGIDEEKNLQTAFLRKNTISHGMCYANESLQLSGNQRPVPFTR